MRWRAWVVVVVALATSASPVEGRLLRIFDDPNTSGGNGLAGAVQSLVLLNGNIVAGAPLAAAGGKDAAGVIYVLAPDGRLLHTLQSPNPAVNGRFGVAIVTAGTDLVVGAPGDTANGTPGVGEVYRLDSTTFAPVATYRPPQLQTGLDFGVALAVDGGTLYVAAANSFFTTTTGAGVVHALDLVSGATLHSFLPPADVQNGGFGRTMVGSGGTLIVGAPGTTAGGDAGAGTVYFLDANADNTVILHTAQSTNPTPDGAYGTALAVAGTALLVGAPGNADLGGPPSGLVYVVDPTTAITRRSFGRLDLAAGADFGRDILVGSDTISVAAPGAPGDGRAGAGQIYQVDPTTFASQRTVSSPNSVVDGHFGTTLATAGTQLVVGEPHLGSGKPTLYLFDSASSGSPGGGGTGGGTTTTSTSTTLPGNCVVAPTFVSVQCELDALTATVTVDALGSLGTRLLAALGRAQTQVQRAQAATTQRQARKALRAAVSALRTFNRRFRSAAGRVTFEQGSVLGRLVGGAEDALLQVLATS